MKAHRRARTTLRYVLVYAVGLAFVAFSVIPLLWGVVTSLKRRQDIYTSPPEWIPNPITFENFQATFANTGLMRSFGNSLVIAVATTLLALVVGVLGAYGFSRYQFPGRQTLMASVLFTQLFPRVVVIVPFFVTLRNLRMMNTYQGLVLVYLMAVFPVAIWLVKGFFDQIPREVEEAAVVDGASVMRLLWSIVVPMSRPALVAVAMYSFVLAWNEFLFALVFTTGDQVRPVSVALAYFITDQGIDWGALMAASLLMSIPSILVFTLSQRLLVKGLSAGAVKG